MTTIQDDRTDEQRQTHRWLVIATDRFMSGWGGAQGGASYAAWACPDAETAHEVKRRIRQRSDMLRVRMTYGDYRPSRACAHLHIYVEQEGSDDA